MPADQILLIYFAYTPHTSHLSTSMPADQILLIYFAYTPHTSHLSTSMPADQILLIYFAYTPHTSHLSTSMPADHLSTYTPYILRIHPPYISPFHVHASRSDTPYILLAKIIAAKNEVALSYHRVRGIYVLAVVFAATIVLV